MRVTTDNQRGLEYSNSIFKRIDISIPYTQSCPDKYNPLKNNYEQIKNFKKI